MCFGYLRTVSFQTITQDSGGIAISIQHTTAQETTHPALRGGRFDPGSGKSTKKGNGNPLGTTWEPHGMEAMGQSQV